LNICELLHIIERSNVVIRAFASVFLATLFLAEPFAVGVAQTAKAVTADEVARRVRDRDTGRD
jgi:hypothetical protein